MKLAFSTLGCPRWTLPEVVSFAAANCVTGIELRALNGSIDLLGRPEFQPSAVGETRRHLTEEGLEICCVDTSCTFDAPDKNVREEQIEVAFRHAELAAQLGAPLIRVFPDRIQTGSTRAETRALIAESLHELSSRIAPQVKIGLETHGDFARTDETVQILRAADHPQVVIIWDAANSFAAGDAVSHAAQTVAPYLFHVHVRDARPVPGEEHWRPVLWGAGLVPLNEVVKTLSNSDYRGYVSFEWEKYWHPEIEEPEIAIPDFLSAIRKLKR